MFALPCLLFQADCFVRGLTLRSNNVVENLCMRPNIGLVRQLPDRLLRPCKIVEIWYTAQETDDRHGVMCQIRFSWKSNMVATAIFTFEKYLYLQKRTEQGQQLQDGFQPRCHWER